jgi:hypothetical protein
VPSASIGPARPAHLCIAFACLSQNRQHPILVRFWIGRELSLSGLREATEYILFANTEKCACHFPRIARASPGKRSSECERQCSSESS